MDWLNKIYHTVQGLILAVVTAIVVSNGQAIWDIPSNVQSMQVQFEYMEKNIETLEKLNITVGELQLEQAREQGRAESREDLMRTLKTQIDSLNRKVDDNQENIQRNTEDIKDIKNRVLHGGGDTLRS